MQAELDKIQAKLAELEQAQAEQTKQSVAPVGEGRVVRLAPRPTFLAGREDLLAELVARLGAGDGREPQVVALHGLAGAGKTSVALAYAHSRRAEDGLLVTLRYPESCLHLLADAALRISR